MSPVVGLWVAVLLGVAQAGPTGDVTGWGISVVFPPNGYGATFQQVAAGGNHSLALSSDGTVVAWGSGGSGESAVPLGLGRVLAIAGGSGFSLALKEDRTVAVWGQGTVPGGLTGVLAIAAGGGIVWR